MNSSRSNRPKSEGTQYWVFGNVIFLGIIGAYLYGEDTGQEPLYCWLGGLSSHDRKRELDPCTEPVA